MKAILWPFVVACVPRGATGVGLKLPTDVSSAHRLRGPRALSLNQLRRQRPAVDESLSVRGACMDDPVGWISNASSTCADYASLEWCTPSGDYGPNWRQNGKFKDWAIKGGASADEACCSCGGGFAVDILLTDVGKDTCHEGVMIEDELECQAVSSLIQADFVPAARWPEGHARGCHTDDLHQTVWFNVDRSAKNDGTYRLLCVKDLEEVTAAALRKDQGKDVAKLDSGEEETNDDRDAEDDDDDDEDDEDSRTVYLTPSDYKLLAVLRGRVARTHAALTQNMRDRVEAHGQLKKLNDDVRRPHDVEVATHRILKETNSGAFAGIVGDMWKEMRLFATPFYEERLREKIERYTRDQKKLQVEYGNARWELRSFLKKKNLLKAIH